MKIWKWILIVSAGMASLIWLIIDSKRDKKVYEENKKHMEETLEILNRNKAQSKEMCENLFSQEELLMNELQERRRDSQDKLKREKIEEMMLEFKEKHFKIMEDLDKVSDKSISKEEKDELWKEINKLQKEENEVAQHILREINKNI